MSHTVFSIWSKPIKINGRQDQKPQHDFDHSRKFFFSIRCSIASVQTQIYYVRSSICIGTQHISCHTHTACFLLFGWHIHAYTQIPQCRLCGRDFFSWSFSFFWPFDCLSFVSMFAVVCVVLQSNILEPAQYTRLEWMSSVVTGAFTICVCTFCY